MRYQARKTRFPSESKVDMLSHTSWIIVRTDFDKLYFNKKTPLFWRKNQSLEQQLNSLRFSLCVLSLIIPTHFAYPSQDETWQGVKPRHPDALFAAPPAQEIKTPIRDSRLYARLRRNNTPLIDLTISQHRTYRTLHPMA